VCARFTLTTRDLAALARAWAAEVDPGLLAGWRPRFNVAPGQVVPLLAEPGGARRLVPASFGLAAPGGALHLNARAETAAGKRSFREAWRHHRAAVPVDGFYEWDGPPGARRPHWLHRPDGRPFLLAGLWSPAAEGGPAFAIVTTEARGAVRPLHDRMPLLLPEPLVGPWLADGPAPELPAPGEEVLADRPVSPRVNATTHDDEGCLAPPPAPPQLRLL